jgi:hypothetical protein
MNKKPKKNIRLCNGMDPEQGYGNWGWTNENQLTLKVEVAGKTLHGRDALDEIKKMVITKDAKQAYDTKEMPLLYEDKN